jgi:dTMP kinase
MATARRGLFVAVEGGEGSGKSRLIGGLEERLRDGGFTVQVTREPGGTALGEQIRTLLLASEGASEALSELLLFEAARAELVASVIRPALERGSVVLCDRFIASSLAYQSRGRGLERAVVEAANRIATDGLSPDLTLLLDLPAATGLRRRAGDGGLNRFDREELAFHERVTTMFRELAYEDPSRWRTIDATMDYADVLTSATAAVAAFLDQATPGAR